MLRSLCNWLAKGYVLTVMNKQRVVLIVMDDLIYAGKSVLSHYISAIRGGIDVEVSETVIERCIETA